MRPEPGYRAEPPSVLPDPGGLLLDAVDARLGMLDTQHHVVLANGALAQVLGTGVMTLRGRDLRPWIDERGQADWARHFAQACAGHRSTCATAFRRADGRVLAVEVALAPVYLRHGEVVAVAIDVADPFDRDGADRMLRWLARATAPLTGEDFFLSVMRNLATAFGFRRAFIAECIDTPVTRVRTLAYWFDAELRPNFEFDIANTPCERTLREGRVICIGEGLGRQYPGALRLDLDGYLGAPIFDADGRHLIGHVAFETRGPIDRGVLAHPLFQIFVSRAAAELRRKRAEDILRASEEKYRLLVEHQTDVLVRYDRDRRLSFASPSFCRLFGVEECAVVGTPYRPCVAEEDRAAFDQAWEALARPPHEVHFEERVLTAQGWRWLAWSQRAVQGTGGDVTAVVAAGRDVTDRRRAEEQSRQHLQQLAHVGRVSAVGEMASALAHELNQPLTAMRTYAQACQRLLAAGEPPERLSEALGRMASQAERAGEILRRLRGFLTRAEGSTMSVAPDFLITEVVDLARSDARHAGVALRVRPGKGLPRVQVDCIQIEQVLLNLVRNGIETLQLADTRTRVLTISSRCDGARVLISVHDNGPGVPPEIGARVFEPFFTTKTGGMGIGLAISRSIAEAHGGSLRLDTTCSRGARFVLALPCETMPSGGGN